MKRFILLAIICLTIVACTKATPEVVVVTDSTKVAVVDTTKSK